MIRNAAASFVCGLTMAGCGLNQERSSLKVIGGAPSAGFSASIGLVFLHKDSRNTGLCSGTFIRDDLVVTAGHCFRSKEVAKVLAFDRLDDFTVRPLTAVFDHIEGVLDMGNTAGFPSSESFLVHPSFMQDDLNKWADIAVVRFGKGASGSKDRATLARVAPEYGERVTMVGFGETIDGDLRSAGRKYTGTNVVVQIPTLPKSEDGRTLSDRRILDMLRLDRSLGPVDPIDVGHAIPDHGDSGGPLFNAAGQLVGMTSFGEPRAFGDADVSTLYTNTAQAEVAAFLKAALSS